MTREGHRQSDEHWNCFKGKVSKETSQRRGGEHMGFSERIDTILNWTELKYKNNNNKKKTTTHKQQQLQQKQITVSTNVHCSN